VWRGCGDSGSVGMLQVPTPLPCRKGAAVVSSLSLLVCVLDQPLELEVRARRDVSGLMRALESVPDQRKRRGRRFNLVVVLAMAVFAVCCGASMFAVIAETWRWMGRRSRAHGAGTRPV
jgi:ABC-type Fe3+ transport system permease subunit